MSLSVPAIPAASASTSALDGNDRPLHYDDLKSRSLDDLGPDDDDDDLPPAYPGPPTRPRGQRAASTSTAVARRPRADEPPPYFARAPDVHMRYGPFATTAHLGASADLRDGFPVAPPPASPFTEHDVTRSDWGRFLDDLKKASRAAGQGARVNLRQGTVGELLDSWNHHFFHPRRMHLVLALGSTAYTGRALLPPDVAHPSPSSSPSLSNSPRPQNLQPRGFLDTWGDRMSEYDYKHLSGRRRRRRGRGPIGTVLVLSATAVMAAVDNYQEKKAITAATKAAQAVPHPFGVEEEEEEEEVEIGDVKGDVKGPSGAPVGRAGPSGAPVGRAGPSSAPMVAAGPPPPENKWRIVISYRP